MQQTVEITKRTRVKRQKARANYEKEAIYNVLDNALVATIAFSDGIHVHAIPTLAWRENDYLYIHGSNGSRLIKCLQTGMEVCVSITHLHGLVLARSAVHHSVNYSSVCIYGAFTTVEETHKASHMQYFLEHWMPGRWQFTREPDKQELAATTLMHIPLKEAVAKSRQGPPTDIEADMQHPVWAGVVPMQPQWQNPQQVAEQDNANLPGLFFRAW